MPHPNHTFIAVDFDGTIVEHDYPRIGNPIPLALYWMKMWQKEGADLLLWTMRSDDLAVGRFTLREAVDYCKRGGIEFYAVNHNPNQDSWTTSPKCYAHIYVDDAAYGCPLVHIPNKRPYVDWVYVGPSVQKEIRKRRSSEYRH